MFKQEKQVTYSASASSTGPYLSYNVFILINGTSSPETTASQCKSEVCPILSGNENVKLDFIERIQCLLYLENQFATTISFEAFPSSILRTKRPLTT